MRYAEFEQWNGPRLNQRSLAERLEAIRAQREHALAMRRQKLMALLSDEEALLQHEIRTGNMNLAERRTWLLSQDLALSSKKHNTNQGAQPPESSFQTTLSEEYDDIYLHNSKLAVRQAETEIEKQKRNEATRKIMHVPEGYDKLPAVDILRDHLYMLEQLRDQEKAAVEEDMINMNRRWLEEEKTLKLKQLDRRNQQSSEAHDALLCNTASDTVDSLTREKYDDHIISMAREKESEEEKQVEELREAQRREAFAYVSQLHAAAERQRLEDQELEANIRAHMNHQADAHAPAGCSSAGAASARSPVITNSLDTSRQSDAQQLSKRAVVDALESERRRCHAAVVMAQEGKRMQAVQAGAAAAAAAGSSSASNDRRPKLTQEHGMELPYPEPYYGRKAVKWYE
ncbi:hypothetical protein KP509_03G027200 [Ceratopteris richardii]|uniref:Uncharacterized protein n=1 Tax=Ceratopteris richardii TaxID=49495 RepID=A0A8T2V5Z7_CERRI|nr:hypothetical protein KP509_03G027200 [Ceratopteris richardii]